MIHIRNHGRRNEQGVVSLLTVMFFMIFISLIVMGFVTIVVADQRQTTDNDLSASALAAARSGVEDGKRVLLYCQTNPSAACDAAINSQDNCKAFISGTPAYGLATSLDVPLGANGEGVTGGANATAYQQYFTCLTIQTKTPSLKTPLNADSDYIQRIKTVSQFKKLKITWSGDGNYLQRVSGVAGWPTQASWNSSGFMPVIQFQTIPYSSLTDLNAVESQAKTVYIVPCNNMCVSLTDIGALDIRSGAGDLRVPGAGAPITYAQCSQSAGFYTCSATLSGYDSSLWQYYVRATLLYASSTTLELSALDQNDVVVNLDNVQPWIDVTGRANDVFRRVRTEVAYKPTVPLPEQALDSAAPICKVMRVTNIAISSIYSCPAP